MAGNIIPIVVPVSTAGNQPNQGEKIMISMAPNQMWGTAAATTSITVPVAWPIRLEQATMEAIINAIPQATSRDTKVTRRVDGSASAITSTTARCCVYEVLKSPVTNWTKYRPYCTSIGSLRWYCSRAASSASAEAWEPGPPIMASAGSPGINRIAINIAVATSHNRIAAAPTRRPNQPSSCMSY